MTPQRKEQIHLAELQRLQRFKAADRRQGELLGEAAISFFKQSIQKRQTKLSRIAEVFEQLVPTLLREHCSIESLSKGALTVLVDSSPHLFDLKSLLLAGLEQQLLIACKSAGLRRIVLKRGQWYQGDSPGDRKLRF